MGLKDVDILTLALSCLAILISIVDRIANNVNNKKTEAKAEQAILLSQGVIEIEIRNSITQARQRLDNFRLELENFKLDRPEADLTPYKKTFYSILEDFFNQYDRGCALFLDKKIDEKRFKQDYFQEIKNIVENGKYKKQYFNKKNKRYKSIMTVYKNWNKND